MVKCSADLANCNASFTLPFTVPRVNDVRFLMNQHFFSNKSFIDLLLFVCMAKHVIFDVPFVQQGFEKSLCVIYSF